MRISYTPYQAAKSLPRRLFTCMYRQRSRVKPCPSTPRLEGKTVLVTGGMAGVGEFISRGLLSRGAKVVSLSRGISQGKGELSDVHSVTCDLADLKSVSNAVDKLSAYKFDILICNSGVALPERKMTPNKIEMTYAVNVLGHHLLYRLLQERGMYAAEPRIVMTTGEAYFATDKCEAKPKSYKMDQVYGGSKLGNLWQVIELVKHYPNMKVFAVHPGVVLSGFGGGIPSGFRHWLASKILISEEQGAQAALIASTQNLPNGSYWHSSCGIMALAEGDAALDESKAAKLWDQLEAYSKPYLT